MGSSPRMRGKLNQSPPRRAIRGLIPAHAGKTRPTPFRKLSRPAHPRACGENTDGKRQALAGAGSSPRMRGKPGWESTPLGMWGLIPAHAGKTGAATKASGLIPAHPRACGENSSLASPLPFPLGSSPRMRGKRLSPRRSRSIPGLIPAHAGKTNCELCPHRPGWAHPRACGENILGKTLRQPRWGSSPRMRGKLSEFFAC